MCAYATRSSPPRGEFHSGRSRCSSLRDAVAMISNRNKILASLQKPGGACCAITFSGCFMQKWNRRGLAPEQQLPEKF